jgi:hypothetical protein
MSRALLDLTPSQVDETTMPKLVTADAPALIDQLMPEYHYRQQFSAFIPSPQSVVFAVLAQLRFSDLAPLRVLMAIRTLGRNETRNADEPILAGARLAPYVLAEELPDQETVIALMGRFWTQNAFGPIPDRAAFAAPPPDFVRTVWSLRLEDAPGGTRVTSETRVKSPADPAAARKFRPYWTFMGQIGSATFSISLLAALKRRSRAEASAPLDPANICATDAAQTVVLLALATGAAAAAVALLSRARKRATASPLAITFVRLTLT